MKKSNKKTFLLYNLTSMLVGVLLYFAIPMMLNYPPNSINSKFELTIDMGVNYYVQYIGVMLISMIIANLSILFELLRVKNCEKKMQYDNSKFIEQINKIKKICFTAPIRLYLLLAFVPSLIISIVLFITETEYLLTLRISTIALCVFLTMGLLIYISSGKIFKNILLNYNNKEIGNNKSFVGFRTKIFFQFLPLTILIGFMAYTITNSVSIKDKGNIIYENYKPILIQQEISNSQNIEDIISKLNEIQKKNVDDTLFIIKDKDYSIIYQDTNKEITDFFIKYTFMEGKANRTYGYYATDVEGVFDFVEINGEKYAAGIMYSTTIMSNSAFIIIALSVLIIAVIIFLIFFSHDISEQVNVITERMKGLIKEQSVDYDKKIPVTSNDELGELTESFNKILDLEKKHVETIKENQDALVENGRLSSLGQLVGGIAHNLKTPIMSISGNLQGIQDLIVEYDSSIGDSEVTPEDHKAIAKDMQELVDKTRIHLSYMSDVITAIKGQAVQLDSSEDQIFGALEVVSRIEILMRHELKSALIEMDVDIEEEAKTAYIKGDVNSLVQVLNNLIQNSIYAYQGKQHQVINFKVTKEDNKLYFRIQDYGCGIPDNVKEKLFKEMVTTKGKNGTGLGLYMSYSTIKGKFNGGFDFKSEVGKGTTFIISIPVSK